MYYFNLALAYKFSKESLKAVSYYEKGLLLQPKNLSITLDLAKLFISMKRFSEAVETLRNAAKIDP